MTRCVSWTTERPVIASRWVSPCIKGRPAAEAGRALTLRRCGGCRSMNGCSCFCARRAEIRPSMAEGGLEKVGARGEKDFMTMYGGKAVGVW